MTLAQHPHELPESDGTYLHLDCKVNGLGGNSCGQGGPLKPDRVLGELHRMKLTICPFFDEKDPEGFNKRRNFPCPVAILRDKAGKVTIVGDGNSDGKPLPLSYRIDNGKVQKYSEPFDLKQGGTVCAWYDGGEEVKTSATFEKIENVPVTVAYVSSEEGPGGEYGKNLVELNRFLAVFQIADEADADIGKLRKTDLGNLLPLAFTADDFRKLRCVCEFSLHEPFPLYCGILYNESRTVSSKNRPYRGDFFQKREQITKIDPIGAKITTQI